MTKVGRIVKTAKGEPVVVGRYAVIHKLDDGVLGVYDEGRDVFRATALPVVFLPEGTFEEIND